MNTLRGLLLLLLAGLGAAAVPARAAGTGAPFQVEAPQLRADYWIERLPAPDRPLLEPAAVTRFNARLLRDDPSMHDLRELPAHYSAAQVRARVLALSSPPTRPLYDTAGAALDPSRLAALGAALALEALPPQVAPRYALVVRRADLRTFPTREPAFAGRDDRDIDRFQESALYPGSAVAILHASRDGRWCFVLAANYAAWIERDRLAEGSRDAVLAYATRTPRLWVTGARAQTVFTPELPAASQLPLDMGTSLPQLADWPPARPVNGQLPLAAHVVQLPVRGDDGRLRLVAALVPRSADVADAPLPATPRQLLRQAFKFLGERYGWGNGYDARDCSGFVSDVYRSLGLALPRNTGDQSRSPVLTPVPYDPAAPAAQRRQRLAQLQAGDLVYIPGHVMMVIGQDRGLTWVIHDVAGASYRDAGGALQRAPLNGVSVTPLEPLLLGSGEPFIDHITRIQRPGPTPNE